MNTTKLATDGGTFVRTIRFAPWPFFDQDEIAVSGACLSSGKVNYWTGDEGREFEKEFAAYSNGLRLINA